MKNEGGNGFSERKLNFRDEGGGGVTCQRNITAGWNDENHRYRRLSFGIHFEKNLAAGVQDSHVYVQTKILFSRAFSDC